MKSSLIGPCETWLDNDKQILRSLGIFFRKRGNICLHIRKGTPRIRKNDPEYFDNELKLIFTESNKYIFMTNAYVITAITLTLGPEIGPLGHIIEIHLKVPPINM